MEEPGVLAVLGEEVEVQVAGGEVGGEGVGLAESVGGLFQGGVF